MNRNEAMDLARLLYQVCVVRIGDEQICGVSGEHHYAYMGNEHRFLSAAMWLSEAIPFGREGAKDEG